MNKHICVLTFYDHIGLKIFILNEKLTFDQSNKSLHSIKVSNLIIRGDFSPAGLIIFSQVIFLSGKWSRAAWPIAEIEAVAMECSLRMQKYFRL